MRFHGRWSRRKSAAVLGLLLTTALVVAAPLPSGRAVPGERTIRIEAASFAFAPGIVRVNRGDRVTIELAARDVVHGLYVDGYDLSVTADPGQTARVSFVADRAGSFRFRCPVACGALHPFMVGKLEVGRNGLLWRAIALALVASLVGTVWRWD